MAVSDKPPVVRPTKSMWIELHNVPIYAMLLICAVPTALNSELDWRFGLCYGAISFLFLGGRILTHGIDLARSGPRWRQYVATNLILNVVGCSVFVVLFWLL